jgi:hypothetical protein
MILLALLGSTEAFSPSNTSFLSRATTTTSATTPFSPVTLPFTTLRAAPDAPDTASDEVVELGDDRKSEEVADDSVLAKAVRGPLFISQGEIDPETLNPDFSDAKQTRVVIYTVLSLLPVLFLIPFMLGRDFIPLDSLPPVDLTP